MHAVDTWRWASVRRITDLTPTVRQFELVPDEGPVPAYAPGSHLNVHVHLRGSGAALAGSAGIARQELRSYSLVGLPDGQALRIAVKRLQNGRGGSRYLWSLREGARLLISEPANHFALDFSSPQVLLVAGGIGITPLVGMAQALMARGADVRMIYAARSATELACLDKLTAAFASQPGRLRTLQSERRERVDFAAEFATLRGGAQAVICGPASMLDSARAAWAAAGRPPADLRFETFGSSGRHAPQPFVVKLPRHGREITVGAETSLLDALEAAGIEVLADCRRGECGLCVLDVLNVEGTIDHRDVFLSESQKAAGDRLCACVSRVAGLGAALTLETAWRGEENHKLSA